MLVGMRSGKLFLETLLIALSSNSTIFSPVWEQQFKNAAFTLGVAESLVSICHQHPSPPLPAQTYVPSTSDTGHPQNCGLETSSFLS